MRKYIIVLISAALGLASCVKPFEWNIPLAVNNERINLLSNEAGYCYIPIYSTGEWNISFEQVPADSSLVATPQSMSSEVTEWYRTDVMSGYRNRTVLFTYDANATGSERQILFVVEGEGERCEIIIVQPE